MSEATDNPMRRRLPHAAQIGIDTSWSNGGSLDFRDRPGRPEGCGRSGMGETSLNGRLPHQVPLREDPRAL